MVDSVTSSINSVLFSSFGANTLSTAPTKNFLQAAYSPNIPDGLMIKNADGSTISLATVLQTNLAGSNNYNILNGASSTSNLLASSYGTASSLTSLLADSYNVDSTDLLI